MREVVNQLMEFHLAGDVPVGSHPRFPDHDRRKLRVDLVAEEVQELIDAERRENLVDVADAIADGIYVLVGMAIEYGLPIAEIFNEVHRSNMAKFGPGMVKRPDGKILKPEGWEPPRVREILAKHVAMHQDALGGQGQ